MFIVPRIRRLATSTRVLLLTALVICPGIAAAEQAASPGFLLRNQNPFLQIFGLPPFQSAQLAAPESYKYDLSFDIANHADAGDNAVEDFVIDGESYFLTLSLRRRVKDRLELGIDLPLVAHADGFLDNAIESWHDTFGMSNTKRRGPSNELGFQYSRDGEILYQLDSPGTGIGDIQLTAAMPIRESRDDDPRSVTLRSSVKLPTGSFAHPMTYRIDGKQYVVVVSGGHPFVDRDPGDWVTAFALPD